MAELPAAAPMAVAEKPPDAPATTLPKKKPPSSSNSKDKKRKGKPPSELPPAAAAEVPVSKNPKTVDTSTSVAEPRRSGVAAVAAAAATLRTFASTVAAAGNANPRLQDADIDGQTTQQTMKLNITSQSQQHGVGCSSTKRKRTVVNQENPPMASKRFRPPMAKKFTSPMMTGSPMMRILMSPLIVRPRSPALDVQNSPEPSHNPRRSWSRSPWRSPAAHSPRTSPCSPIPRNQALEEGAYSSNQTIAAMVVEMQAKFDKYWMISYLTNCIPVILDPRFKYGFIEFRLKQAFGKYGSVEHLEKVNQAMRKLFNAYSAQMGGSSQVDTHGDDVTPAGISHSWSDWSAHTSAKNQVNNEYDRYLRDDLHPCNDESFDILNWWKMHAFKYPTLAAMARDILAATASTVPSESAFSTSGRVINDYRTRLAGSTVEALLCYQDWLRSAGPSYMDIISIDNLSEDNADGW